jgi:hypothetical protein
VLSFKFEICSFHHDHRGAAPPGSAVPPPKATEVVNVGGAGDSGTAPEADDPHFLFWNQAAEAAV